MGAAPLELTVAAKGLAHWITTGLPLVIAVPVLGLLLDLDPLAIGAVALTLLVGTPALTFIGMIGAALAVALRRGGLLLPVLVMPLTVPVLIFGVSAAETVVIGPVSFGWAVDHHGYGAGWAAVTAGFALAAALTVAWVRDG